MFVYQHVQFSVLSSNHVRAVRAHSINKLPNTFSFNLQMTIYMKDHNSGAPVARRTAKRSPIPIQKGETRSCTEIETHATLFSCQNG